MLFFIIINNIDKGVIYSTARLFTDDTRLSKSVTDVISATQLQIDANSIYKWAEDNHMEFNDDKFELLRYRVRKMLFKIAIIILQVMGT